MNGIRTDVETSAWAEGGCYANLEGVLRWQRSVSACTFDRSVRIGGQGGSKVVTSNLDALCLPRRRQIAFGVEGSDVSRRPRPSRRQRSRELPVM